MATGRLASGSIAAGGATQLYRNSTGNAQVITLLASSQVSGKAPKLNVKITNENFTETSSVTTVVAGTNHTIDTNYPALSTQLTAGTGTWMQSAVDHHGSRLHLNVGSDGTWESMGQAWSMGENQTQGGTKDHPWGKASFDGQPVAIGGSNGGDYRYANANASLSRSHMPVYPPYYFENPNAFNQNKARGVLSGQDGGTIFHIEDISKMDPSTMWKYYNYYEGQAEHSHTAPSSDSATYGTVTTRSTPQSYGNRGWIYDIYTGLSFHWNSSGYNAYMWFDEANPGETDPSGDGYNQGDSTSNGGVWLWSYNQWQGSDPQSYDTDGNGSVYGCYADCENGLICAHAGRYAAFYGFKYYDKYFDNMTNKDTRASNQNLETFSRSSYYHTHGYSGADAFQKLQWVSYHPGNDKYYVCFWDNTGSYGANPVPTMGSTYPEESGIFEVHVDKIRGKDQAIGNTYLEHAATWKVDGILTKKAVVPDTVSGLMSKPMRIADSLWTAHCQDGKQYFSTDLYTWAEKSSTYIPDAYQMVNASIKGDAGAAVNNYFIATDSKSVVYSVSQTVSTDVYDQAAAAGIIAKGAVTPYEQKAIILSDGDAIYVENEDATNAISVTAMGVDV